MDEASAGDLPKVYPNGQPSLFQRRCTPGHITFGVFLGALLLTISASMKITFFSGLSLCIAFFYLRGPVSRDLNIFFLCISLLQTLGKFTLILLTAFTTALSTLYDCSEFDRTLLESFGIFLFRRANPNRFMSIFPELMSSIGIIIAFTGSNFRGHPGKERIHSAGIWCWLSIVAQAWTCTFSRSVLFVPTVVTLLVTLGLWGICDMSMARRVFRMVAGPVMCVTGTAAIAVCLGQVPLVDYTMDSELLRAVLGLGTLVTPNGACAYIGLLFTFLFTALYGRGDTLVKKEHAESVNPFQENLLKIEVRGSSEQSRLGRASTPQRIMSSIHSRNSRVSRARRRQSEGCWGALCRVISRFCKYCTQTPFLALQAVRIFLLVWILKYSTYTSLFLLCWLYYSVAYSDKTRFYFWTRVSIIPITGFQYLMCKVANIPEVMYAQWRHSGTLQELGIFLFGLDKHIVPEGEFIWMGTVFFLCCLTGRLTRLVPSYDSWILTAITSKERESRSGSWEAVAYMLLSHMDTIFIVMVFLVGFNKLNAFHVLLIVCMLIGMQFPQFISRHFNVFVVLVLIRDLGRYIALLVFLSGTELTARVGRVMKIVGFDNDFSADKLFYKVELDWEIPAMIYFCYIQLHVYRYLEGRHVDPQRSPGCFVGLLEYLYSAIVEKVLIWIIYGVLLLIVVCQDVSITYNIYMAVLVLIIVVHLWSDIKDDHYRGYGITKVFWRILSLYNGIVLFASYMFCFATYTVGVELSLSDEIKAICKLVGFDFVSPNDSGFQMQKRFLPQFMILYLGLFATTHIQERLDKPFQGIDVLYTRKIVYLSLRFNVSS